MRSDGTLDIVLGSLVAGIGAYIYQFLGGRSLGEEAFAPIGALLTAHFLAFVIILLPIEHFVIRRITLGYRGWVVPIRAIALTISTAFVAAVVVWASADTYFEGDASFVWFVIATVGFHFFFVVGIGTVTFLLPLREVTISVHPAYQPLKGSVVAALGPLLRDGALGEREVGDGGRSPGRRGASPPPARHRGG